ncbi:MAG: cobalamin-dependent protein [Candidatus Methanoglobus sp.]|jgi:methylmalonyl-CoA mutase cobalamin-binding domain/chain
MALEELEEGILKTIEQGDAEECKKLLEQFLKKGGDLLALISRGTKLMQELGQKFEKGEIYLPDVMMAAEAFSLLTEALKSQKGAKAPKALGKVVLATVQGDVHDLGKNIVATMLAAEGFDVVNLGRDVPADTIVEAAVREKADIVGTSALMTTTVIEQKKVKEKLDKVGWKGYYFIGGGATSDEWANEIGAIRGEDAIDAVKKAKKVMGV